MDNPGKPIVGCWQILASIMPDGDDPSIVHIFSRTYLATEYRQ
jgi:hypothetical protein